MVYLCSIHQKSETISVELNQTTDCGPLSFTSLLSSHISLCYGSERLLYSRSSDGFHPAESHQAIFLALSDLFFALVRTTLLLHLTRCLSPPSTGGCSGSEGTLLGDVLHQLVGQASVSLHRPFVAAPGLLSSFKSFALCFTHALFCSHSPPSLLARTATCSALQTRSLPAPTRTTPIITRTAAGPFDAAQVCGLLRHAVRPGKGRPRLSSFSPLLANLPPVPKHSQHDRHHQPQRRVGLCCCCWPTCVECSLQRDKNV